MIHGNLYGFIHGRMCAKNSGVPGVRLSSLTYCRPSVWVFQYDLTADTVCSRAYVMLLSNARASPCNLQFDASRFDETSRREPAPLGGSAIS